MPPLVFLAFGFLPAAGKFPRARRVSYSFKILNQGYFSIFSTVSSLTNPSSASSLVSLAQ
jgi:hypothetical protein